MTNRRYRHTDVCAVLGPDGFEAPRAPRAPRAARASAGVARVVDAIQSLGRRVDASAATNARMSTNLDGLADTSRRAAFRGRV